MHFLWLVGFVGKNTWSVWFGFLAVWSEGLTAWWQQASWLVCTSWQWSRSWT